MNIVKSFSALITKQGYCVKAVLTDKSSVVFFTDNDMNHRTWQATENNPDLLLNIHEFHRLRDRVKLKEVSLLLHQEKSLLPIVENLLKDPYYGFDEVWRRKNKVTEYDLKRNKGPEVVPRYIEDTGSTLGQLPGLSELKKRFV